MVYKYEAKTWMESLTKLCKYHELKQSWKLFTEGVQEIQSLVGNTLHCKQTISENLAKTTAMESVICLLGVNKVQDERE